MSAQLVIPEVGRFHPIKAACIHIKCRRCGKTRSNMPRQEFDPEDAAVMLMSYCDRCDTGGEFESVDYFKVDGTQILESL